VYICGCICNRGIFIPLCSGVLWQLNLLCVLCLTNYLMLDDIGSVLNLIRGFAQILLFIFSEHLYGPWYVYLQLQWVRWQGDPSEL